MNEVVFQILTLISVFCPSISDIGCNTHATLLRQVEREGFHLDIHSLIEVVVDIETAASWQNCTLVLREKIPDSFFVNPDQLSELSRIGKLHACTPDLVDTESPQHLSNGHTVYIYGEFKRSENLIYSHLKLPLHLRYQQPRHGGGYATAIMKSPTLLIQCIDEVECNSLTISKASCFMCSNKLCNWMRFPYKTNVQNFTLSVPIAFIWSSASNQQSDKQHKLSKMFTAEKRHFDNPYTDFAPHKENNLVDVQSKKIHPLFVEKLRNTSGKLLDVLDQHLPSGKKDGSVYTGTAGVALLYLMLYEKTDNASYLEKANDLIEKSLQKLKNKDVSFLCGDAGPLAIAAVLFYKQNKVERAKECISRLLGLMPRVSAHEGNVPDELLYGRVGYLYSLLFLNKHIPGIVPNDFFKQVVTAVILSGRNLSKRENISIPLMYEWYEECYLGGAHGIAGIMYLILQVVNEVITAGQALAEELRLNSPLMFEWHNKNYLGGAHGISGILYLLLQAKQYLTSEQLHLVRPTIDFLINIRYASGNFPSSLGSNSDRLVHWCHGAPGTVQMLCAAYQVFSDPRYLQAAETCGDVVWERGLLRKGYGICHGVAGNAYTFLILYQMTRDLKHLYRACSFAEWCTTYNQYQERVPDRPYSLFEGLAGTIYFLNDMQDPLNAKFPCFTL